MDHANNIIVGHLNISLNRNKFILAESTTKTFDLFFIVESKLDNTFPMNQFRNRGCKIFRRDRNQFEGGLMLYINENILYGALSDHLFFLIWN